MTRLKQPIRCLAWRLRSNVRSPRWENVEWLSRVCHGSDEPLHSLYFRKNWKFVPVRVAKEGLKLHWISFYFRTRSPYKFYRHILLKEVYNFCKNHFLSNLTVSKIVMYPDHSGTLCIIIVDDIIMKVLHVYQISSSKWHNFVRKGSNLISYMNSIRFFQVI